MAKFSKGVSGNPGGRPKAVKAVEDLAKEYTEAVVLRLAAIATDPSGDPRACVAAGKEILDRAWGRPKQTLSADVTVREGLASALEAARNRVRGR